MISDCVSRHLEVGEITEMAIELVILASALGRINIPYRKYSSLLVVFTPLCMHEKKKKFQWWEYKFRQVHRIGDGLRLF